MSRRDIGSVFLNYICYLLDESAVDKILSQIDYEPYENIVFIHPVGKFKFEKDNPNVVDNDGDGIDDEVYATNVVTLKNVLKPLTLYTKNKTIKVCVFASVSDKYHIPFWISYKKAKDVMREYLKELSIVGKIKPLIVNVSTVDTGNENMLRPKADKTYWLQPEEVVKEALEKLEDLHLYEEIDVIKPKPGFNEDYYLDHDAILEKWKKEMDTKE